MAIRKGSTIGVEIAQGLPLDLCRSLAGQPPPGQSGGDIGG